MKRLAMALGTFGLMAGGVLVLRRDDEPAAVEGPSRREAGIDGGITEEPAAAMPGLLRRRPRLLPPRARPELPEPVKLEPPPDPLDVYASALGARVLDTVEQCLADHDPGITLDVSVDYRLDGAWIVVETATTTPAIAAVEDCIADRLARTAVEPPPAPDRVARMSFSAGVVHKGERRIETTGQTEWIEP